MKKLSKTEYPAGQLIRDYYSWSMHSRFYAHIVGITKTHIFIKIWTTGRVEKRLPTKVIVEKGRHSNIRDLYELLVC